MSRQTRTRIGFLTITVALAAAGTLAAVVTSGVDSTAPLLVEDQTAEADQGDRGDRQDDCDPRPYKSGDDCADITTHAIVSGRTCTGGGNEPCLSDYDCPGGETCQTGNIVYLTGDMMLATRTGACTTSGALCEYDDECAEGVCEAATTGCHSHADCPEGACSTSGLPCHQDSDCLTGGLDICEGGRRCIGGETCDNQPCSLSPQRRCTTDPPGGEPPTGFGCVPGEGDCEPPRVCVHGDRGWWEGFVLDDCSNLAVSYCCEGPQWVYGALCTPESCAECETAYSSGYTDFEVCDDGRRTFYYYGMPPGTYYQPIYAAGDPNDDGVYQLRLDAWAARGACCSGALFDTCTDGISPCACEAIGGAYMGDGVSCVPDPCPQLGACCHGPELDVCTDGLVPSACGAMGGVYLGDGTDCGPPDPCELWACCRNGGADCTVENRFSCDDPGAYLGYLDHCLGDLNGNGIDDVCEDACTLGAPDTCYGDGSTPAGECDISEDTVLTHGLNCVDLHVHENVVLDTAGYIVRVCRTLLNEGTMTDTHSGGGSGPTVGGRGQDPCEDSGGPPQAEDGSGVCLSWAPGPGSLAGGGGACGGSGAGGGGAKWLSPCADADGGDGGDGGRGGRGGGWVRIHAYNLDNQGLVHADGGDGQPGEPGTPGGYWYLGRCRDVAGGGGGGGAGGGGGDGGTVEIYYATPSSNLGTIQASAGLGGAGGDAGTSGGCCVCLDAPDYETSGLGGFGFPLGGDGGDGAWQQGTCAEPGEPGGAGADGVPGQVSSFGPQACCLGDGTCVDVDPFCCADLNGTAQGPGTMCAALQACCLADDTCEMLDPLCCADQGGAPQGPGTTCLGPWACCFDGGTTCRVVDRVCCEYLGGYEGGEDHCLGDADTDGIDDACVVPEACCLQADDTCEMLLPEDCEVDPDIGIPQGPGTVCTGPRPCCLGGGTACVEVDPLCCDELGGYVADGDNCLGDLNSNGIDDACEVGACCELLGNRCFNYWAWELDPPPVSTVGCETDADCEDVATTCGVGPEPRCICLPHYTCWDDVWPEDCSAPNQRYGGGGTTCEPGPEYPQIDPPCGLGACCYFNDTCHEEETPFECVGGISDGDSTWLGEGSECSATGGPFEDLECPTACPMNTICHPDLGCTPGYGHPYDGESLYLADSTSNGICSASGICSTSGAPCDSDDVCTGGTSDVCDYFRCDADDDCPGSDVCVGELVKIVADSFIPLDTPVGELCWRGVYMNEDGDDCSTNLIAGSSTFTIRFWEDTDCDALPGDAAGTGGLIAEYVNLTPQRSLSGFMFGPHKEWEYHAQFPNVFLIPGNCYFVEIAATNSPGNCDFWIETSTVGDDVMAIDDDADGIYDSQSGFDLAWLMDITVKAEDCRPANDDCAAVILGAATNGLSHGARVPYETSYAGTDGPPHPKSQCGIGGLGDWTIENDIWYTYTPECTGTLTVDICTSGFDTGLAIYNLGGGVGTSGWICPTDTTYLVACNNDACGTTSTSGLQSRVAVPVTQGDKILIRVGGYEPADRGCGLLKVDLLAVEIESVQSCQEHDGVEYCLDIGEGGTRAYDNVEPRLQKAIPLELEFTATGNVASNGVTLTVSCTPPPGFGGTATVVTDGTNVGRVVFSEALPNKSCCTLTFSGDIEDCWPIVILEADVNRDCQVSSPDSSSVKARLTDPVTASNYWYDVNRDNFISTTDKSSVKARLQDVVSCPCTCP